MLNATSYSMKTSQAYKARFLGVPPPTLCVILKGKRKISWPFAERLSKIFPEKGIEWWRYASPLQLELFFDANIPKPEGKEENRK